VGAALMLMARTRGELVASFRGSSMEPTVRDGAELLLRHGIAPSVGDIVAFLATGGSLVLHRVEAVSARDGSLLSRGDSLWLPDPPLRDTRAIVGVVVGVREGSGFVDPPSAPRGVLRTVALLPFRAVHGASPATAARLLGALRAPGRAARSALSALAAAARRRPE